MRGKTGKLLDFQSFVRNISAFSRQNKLDNNEVNNDYNDNNDENNNND